MDTNMLPAGKAYPDRVEEIAVPQNVECDAPLRAEGSGLLEDLIIEKAVQRAEKHHVSTVVIGGDVSNAIPVEQKRYLDDRLVHQRRDKLAEIFAGYQDVVG